MLGNVLNMTDHYGRGRQLVGRRTRRLEVEAAEVAEIDRWLLTMRSGPEMVLYPADPASVTPKRPASPSPKTHAKKRRR